LTPLTEGQTVTSSEKRVAYLVNQYPAVSHTFIRREIFALERLGVTVDRISLTGWDLPLVDAHDISEREKTRYVQKGGVLSLLREALKTAVARPGLFFKALGAALSMSRNAVRPLPYHLIYLAQACRVQNWVAETGATHLHAHFGTNPAEIACLVRILGGPEYSFTNHGSNELDGAPRLHFPRKIGLAKFAVAVSHYCRSQLLRVIPYTDWEKLKVIHCGLDAEYFTDDPLPLPDAPRFLCVGRLSPVKGHLLLIDAFAEVYKAHPEARLTLAGDGEEMRPAIEARIAELGLGEVVEITGWVDADRVKAELARCTALVQPSLIEGLPVVIMEAMARKRPVVSTFIAGIPELVQPGRTGWIIPAGDVPSLVEALREAISTDLETLSKMGEVGQARARDRHLIDTEAAKLKALFFGDAA
jgi:glycosyltransferase involved in cell wall biosynthesis